MMTLFEIRETLTLEGTHYTDLNTPLLIQKKINLQAFKKHTINLLDVFDDASILPQIATAGYQFFVSRYPITLDEGQFANTWSFSGPEAADDNVLYKENAVAYVNNLPLKEYFPNQFLGSSPTFEFYTPHVYLTLILFAADETLFSDPSFSVYMALDAKRVDSVEFGIGAIGEYLNAQVIKVMSNGVIRSDPFDPSSFPMWKAGGIRPEYMLRANALADFWGAFGSNFSEQTMPTSEWRLFMDDSKVMVGYNEAFGSYSAKGGVPDWIRMTGVSVMSAGAIRDEYPPHVVADSGVTRMV